LTSHSENVSQGLLGFSQPLTEDFRAFYTIIDPRNNWRIWTERDRTSDEYGILVRNLFSSSSISFGQIDGIAVSCVVPPMLNMLLERSCDVSKVENRGLRWLWGRRVIGTISATISFLSLCCGSLMMPIS
jgi:hypothetical protein